MVPLSRNTCQMYAHRRLRRGPAVEGGRQAGTITASFIHSFNLEDADLLARSASELSGDAEDCATSVRVTRVPEKVRKCPRTQLTIMCLTVTDTSECTGSMVQVPATKPGLEVVAKSVTEISLTIGTSAAVSQSEEW